MRNDTTNVAARVIEALSIKLNNPDAKLLDPSPLRHGIDSRNMANYFLGLADGERKLAFKLLREDLEKRYIGFKATQGAPGYLEFDRIRQYIYRIGKKVN